MENATRISRDSEVFTCKKLEKQNFFIIFIIFQINNLKTLTRNNIRTLCFTEIIWKKSGKIVGKISFQPICGILFRSKTFNWNWIHPDIVSWFSNRFLLGSRVQRHRPINKKSLLIVIKAIFFEKITEMSEPYRIENLENQGKL